jgi:hypothetical protein
MQHKFYVPILKSKQGELDSLKELAPGIKAKTVPLLEILPTDDGDKEGYLQRLAKKIATGWAGSNLSIFIDGQYFYTALRHTNGSKYLQFLTTEIEKGHATVIPVTSLNTVAPYREEVKQLKSNGICFRLTPEQLSDASFDAFLEQDMLFYDIEPEQCDLVIDLPGTLDGQPNAAADLVTNYINRRIPMIQSWRTVTVAGSSFPIDLSNVPVGVNTLERKEWSLYQRLFNNPLVVRKPFFGDYAISHEALREFDIILTPSASIRYTIDGHWLIMRGQNLKRHGFVQFHSLSASLVNHEAFSGSDYSSGDRFISECAKRATGTGNLTTWRKVGNNHHITLVVDRLSRIGAV